MFLYFNEFKIIFFSCWIHAVVPMNLVTDKNPSQYPIEWNNDLAEYLVTKGVVPNEKDLPKEKDIPKTSILKDTVATATPKIIKLYDILLCPSLPSLELISKSVWLIEEPIVEALSYILNNDVTYLLSKLSDDELIKLLKEQPTKTEYNIRDIIKLATKNTNEFVLQKEKDNLSKPLAQFSGIFESPKNIMKVLTNLEKPKQEGPVFRLDNKEVDPFAPTRVTDPQYAAVQKLKNLLYSRPSEVEPDKNNDDEDEKKELLFDVLVAQLKTLCCKRNKPAKKKDKSKLKLKALLNDIMPQPIIQKPYVPEHKYSLSTMPNEHMFLIINDEIKSNGSDDGLISVDPDSLGTNSSVMLLGPIATPLSEAQLKIVMMRITNELSKPEYVPLLQQISEGTLSDENIRLVNSLVSGPQTRRYIKPHRCNHQSKLSKVYGGPKWLVCTGYLNLNAASFYD